MAFGAPPPYYEYPVRSGDSMSLLISKFYGFSPASADYRGAQEYLLALNPEIKNPDRIQIGQILRVGEYPPPSILQRSSRSILDTLQDPPLRDALNGQSFILSQPMHLTQHDHFWALSWLEHHSNWLTIPGGIALGATSNLMSKGNVSLIQDVADLYAAYQKNILTKGQYDAKRKALLTRFKQNIGPFEGLLFGNRSTHQAIRIARAGGIPATAEIARHAQRLKHLAAFGRHGGYILTGLGITAACMQIAHTQDKGKKNEIFVEQVGSLVAGFGAGIVTLFIVSNPVGWGTALVLAVGGAVASYGGGKFANWAYTASGTSVDFVTGMGVDQVCR